MIERLESDIHEYNEMSRGHSALQVSKDERIVVSRTRDQPPYDSPWASVERQGNYLLLRAGRSAHSADIDEIRLLPFLNADSECRLKRGSTEIELWQVSRLILEPLLVRR